MPTKTLLTAAALLLLLTAKAEEQPSSILSAISSTTITGYVNVSANWNPGSTAIRFEDLCRELRQRGFQMKRYGKHHLFLRSDKLAFYLCKQGPFARRSDVRQVRHFLKHAGIMP